MRVEIPGCQEAIPTRKGSSGLSVQSVSQFLAGGGIPLVPPWAWPYGRWRWQWLALGFVRWACAGARLRWRSESRARPALALRCARPGVRLRSRSGFLRSRSAALALGCARARLRSGASTEPCARARLRSEASTGTSSTDLGTGGWAQPAEIITAELHDYSHLL